MKHKIDYYSEECGTDCTPNGCPGHRTTIPESISVNGFILVPEGWSYDEPPFYDDPRRLDLWVRTVKALAEALEKMPEVKPDPSIPEPPDEDPNMP